VKEKEESGLYARKKLVKVSGLDLDKNMFKPGIDEV
jgi:hypothetical protein